MNARDAVALIRDAVPRAAGTWADLGAGEGTFTRALADLLEPPSVIYAVDRDAGAIRGIERRVKAAGVRVVAVVADFTRSFDLPGGSDSGLDGLLLANALHYAADATSVLTQLVRRLRLGGRVVLVEYDRRGANPWVPYPISIRALPALADAAGLSAPEITAKRRSMFGGDLYAAAMNRPA